MFCRCESLKSLDLSNFDTRNVTSMREMFVYCTSLTDVDLSSFELNPAGNVEVSNMFSRCGNLKTIYASANFDNTKITVSSEELYSMFHYNNNLVGGAGTAYSNDNRSTLYARIDDPANGKPGYFTLKQN